MTRVLFERVLYLFCCCQSKCFSTNVTSGVRFAIASGLREDLRVASAVLKAHAGHCECRRVYLRRSDEKGSCLTSLISNAVCTR